MEGKTVPHKEVSTDQDRSSINKIPDSVNDAENNNGNGDHVTDSEKTVEKKTSVKNGIVRMILVLLSLVLEVAVIFLLLHFCRIQGWLDLQYYTYYIDDPCPDDLWQSQDGVDPDDLDHTDPGPADCRDSAVFSDRPQRLYNTDAKALCKAGQKAFSAAA